MHRTCVYVAPGTRTTQTLGTQKADTHWSSFVIDGSSFEPFNEWFCNIFRVVISFVRLVSRGGVFMPNQQPL